MTADLFWTRPAAAGVLPEPAVAEVHALVIGVSAYDNLPGGAGPLTASPILAGLTQLSAAATSAARVADWLSRNFDYPDVRLGSVRLLASPSPAELPLPGGIAPPPATAAEVRRSLAAWRAQARATPGNITLLFVAGHGIQTSNEGGILLLQDVGAPGLGVLENALDIVAVRRGMLADPLDPTTSTPPVQYYFYDACRVQPTGLVAYEELRAGITVDVPRGAAPDMSWVLFGSRSRDYALADPTTRTTLFSQALLDCLATRAPADGKDGRTVRFGPFQLALEEAVDELASAADEQQSVVPGGSGQVRTPVCWRPMPVPPARPLPIPPPSVPAGPATAASPPDSTVDIPAARRIYVPEKSARRWWPRSKPQANLPGPRATPPPASSRPRPTTTPPAEPRPVTIATDANQQFEVTIAGSSGVTEATTGVPVALAPGDYQVRVHGPWGAMPAAAINVPSGSGGMTETLAAPGESPRSIAGSARLANQLGSRGGGRVGWQLRFLTWGDGELRYSADVARPAVEVDNVDDDQVAMIVYAASDGPAYAQFRTDDGRSLVVAMPISAAAAYARSCWVHLRVSDVALGAVVRYSDPRLDACAGYLTGGRPDRAAELGPDAEEMLYSKMSDPIAAALGAYAVLKLNELDRLHDWSANLANWFAFLPDGPVLAAETAARRGDDAGAATFLAGVRDRGVPLFGEGLSLLATRAQALAADPDLAPDQAEQLAQTLRPLTGLLPVAEFGTVATTLHLDPDPGGVTADAGWRRFAYGGRKRDPRDFWTTP